MSELLKNAVEDKNVTYGKVANMVEAMKLEFREFEIPEPASNSLLVKVLRTNVCGSELHIWKGLHPTKKTGVLGHEMVGVIEKIGPELTTDFAGQPIKVGDRVAACYFRTCLKCKACLRGDFNTCENSIEFWNKRPEEYPHFHGAFASHYYIHPNQYFYKVPDNIPDVAAASANCALSQVYYGLDQGELATGETVVIQGAGGLGLNAAAVAKERGAQVIVIDGVESRLETAKEFGADHVINFRNYESPEQIAEVIRSFTNGEGADLGLEVSGVPAAFGEGIQFIRNNGRYVTMGNISPGINIDFDPGLLTRKGIKIIPVLRYKPWYLKKSLQFLSKYIDKYPFDKMIDCEIPFENIAEALDKSARREVTRASITI
ncbi:zinc-binding dehydrogenase [Bacillus sp. ISL-47]|uniref:zinc-binding dehydrogenase n=1 Tax=Bacillus sp. ISL-47 TaxID=2819130 RepID=UPI001BE97E22|nr:zinc-binding dehydrogenase [Bacillus sp. ISL-47]MBT2689842.1 zinc-binding dehydrogenase [Bacillus sp. ISL-47]MBT2710219.1 zinc-binding dehydrogenase [Pseudomonas sp. ISL-84]